MYTSPAFCTAERIAERILLIGMWLVREQAKPFAVGLNCALGASDMKPYVENLSKCADCYVFAYPNAGLPNAMGGYDQKDHEMAAGAQPTLDAVTKAIIPQPRCHSCCINTCALSETVPQRQLALNHKQTGGSPWI